MGMKIKLELGPEREKQLEKNINDGETENIE